VVFRKKENDTFFDANAGEEIKERIIDNSYDFDMTVLGLPESFLNVLPLYVAGELYFEDEPQIAQKYLKDFDEFIYYEPKLDRVKQTRIKKINRIW